MAVVLLALATLGRIFIVSPKVAKVNTATVRALAILGDADSFEALLVDRLQGGH